MIPLTKAGIVGFFAVLFVATSAVAGDPPSLALARFGGAHLDQILAPIDQDVNLPRTELIQIRESFLDYKAKAPANEQTAWSMAIRVCDALNNAMDQREQARSGLENAAAVYGSYDLNARRADHPRNWREWERERHEEDNRKEQAAQKDHFLNTTLRTNWTQRAMQLRQQIVSLHNQLQELERQSQQPGGAGAPASDTITLQKPTVVNVKYGRVTLPAGLSLHVVNRDPRGMTAEYNGELVILPPQ